MKVKIDKEKCIGCGSCAAICPEVYEMVGDKAKVKTPKTDSKCAKEGAESCPTQAIIID
ncbi:MAG: ferredoxin [Nanoarchaeota archaeon]